MSEHTLLYEVADGITTGWELCGSRWQNTEAETIACQAIASCRLNHKTHGDAFSWQGGGTRRIGGGGLFDNPKGIQSLVDDSCIVLEPYHGDLSAPEGTVEDAQGRPMIIHVTQRLLEYAASKITEAERRAANAKPQPPRREMSEHCSQCEEHVKTIELFRFEREQAEEVAGQLEHKAGLVDELLPACEELMPILREPLHWRLLVPGERKLILRIEAAIAKANPQPEVR